MMPKKKSLVLTLVNYSLTFVVVLFVGTFVMQEQILNYAFQEGKTHIVTFAQKAGIAIDELDAQELRFGGTDSITFGSFSTVLTLPNQKQLSFDQYEDAVMITPPVQVTPNAVFKYNNLSMYLVECHCCFFKFDFCLR